MSKFIFTFGISFIAKINTKYVIDYHLYLAFENLCDLVFEKEEVFK